MSERIESGPLSDVDRDDELACDGVGGRGPSRPMGKLAGSVPVLRRVGRRGGAGTSEVANDLIGI